jgi:methyl-accepting chemotaxis protein
LVAVDASALVIQTDMEGRIMEVNKKFSSIVKKHRDELIGTYLRNIFVFNVEADEYYNLLHELKQGKLINRNEVLEFEDGNKVFLVLNYSPILDREGKPYKVLGIATNITDKIVLEDSVTKKELEVREVEYQLAQFDQFIDSGFIKCELTSECVLVSTNENYAEVTGYTSKESLGKDYRTFLKPDELKQFELIWTEVLKDKPYKAVIKRTMPAGDEHWLMASFMPFKNKSEKISRVVIVAQDITEKKLKYQVLEEANKEIERLKGIQTQS